MLFSPSTRPSSTPERTAVLSPHSWRWSENWSISYLSLSTFSSLRTTRVEWTGQGCSVQLVLLRCTREQRPCAMIYRECLWVGGWTRWRESTGQRSEERPQIDLDLSMWLAHAEREAWPIFQVFRVQSILAHSFLTVKTGTEWWRDIGKVWRWCLKPAGGGGGRGMAVSMDNTIRAN